MGEGGVGMVGQADDEGAGECTPAHVGQGFGVDDVIAMAGAQQLEKVATALGAGGAEPGELSVANLGAVAVRSLVARTGVVGGNPSGIGKPGTQHAAGFLQEVLLAGDHQPNDLTLANVP